MKSARIFEHPHLSVSSMTSEVLVLFEATFTSSPLTTIVLGGKVKEGESIIFDAEEDVGTGNGIFAEAPKPRSRMFVPVLLGGLRSRNGEDEISVELGDFLKSPFNNISLVRSRFAIGSLVSVILEPPSSVLDNDEEPLPPLSELLPPLSDPRALLSSIAFSFCDSANLSSSLRFFNINLARISASGVCNLLA